MRTAHLFAGAGGGLLADLILGHTPVLAVEWDAYCCAVLRERTQDGWFPGLHVHEGDVRLFDPSEWKGRVDCIHAGFPCQDISAAGAGAGVDGERSGLYREVLRIADIIRPRYIFLENSPAIVVRGLGTLLGDLATRRFNARWTVLAAEDVGAPHIRERWWLLGWRDEDGWQPGSSSSHSDQTRVCGQRGEHDRAAGEARPGIRDAGWLCQVANADHQGAGRRERGQSVGASQRYTPRSALQWWGAEPDVGRLAYGLANRVDQIAALGNGQVPLCCAAAWRILGGP